MPLNPDAAIEITAFQWVPEFAQGLVRDLRVRWALEEAGLAYKVRLVGQERPLEYLKEQPFDQVPCFNDGKVRIFETGAIVQYIGEQSEALLPRDAQGRYRAIQWTYAALNSVEPPIMMVNFIDLQPGGVADGVKPLRDTLVGWVGTRLDDVASFLGDREHLVAGRFTAADLLMTTVLRILRNTDLVASRPTLDAYRKRNEERPAFVKALAAQLAAFAKHAPPAQR